MKPSASEEVFSTDIGPLATEPTAATVEAASDKMRPPKPLAVHLIRPEGKWQWAEGKLERKPLPPSLQKT